MDQNPHADSDRHPDSEPHPDPDHNPRADSDRRADSEPHPDQDPHPPARKPAATANDADRTDTVSASDLVSSSDLVSTSGSTSGSSSGSHPLSHAAEIPEAHPPTVLGDRAGDETPTPSASADPADPTAPSTPAPFAPTPDTRPADLAREALRAARRERQAEAEATRAEVRRSRVDARAGDAEPSRLPSPSPTRRPAPAPSPVPSPVAAARAATAAARPRRAPTARASESRRSRTAGESRADVVSTPSSPAAPHRDGDLRRTFPAFPPRRREDDARFATTWWGNAWITALEDGALDAKRLARGRRYAEQGHVAAITVEPGLVLAYVHGSRPRPYRVQVRLRTLDDADWERFLDAAADRPGHIAALLDKEVPHSLAEGDVPLLPGPGDLDPRCSCPDSGHPCKHAAALCYQTARLLDADPFVLFLLRGRGERPLLDALSRLSAARAARAAQDRAPAQLPGVRATEALAPRELPPLPAPSPLPPHPGQPPVYPAAPGGPDPFALDQLATDAAARAHALLATGRDPVGELTLWQDAVRLAAARPGSGLTAGTRTLYSSLAAAAGRTPAELARAVAAWRQGGPEGLAVLEEPWDPPAGRFDRARPLLLAADLPAFRPWRNRLTHPLGHVQLRLGRDGLWYAYESDPGQDDWWPRGTPDTDPVGALTGLGAPGP
ncbi:SWIM zinc finger family protein [Streptomyces sp. NPDC006610]|uniref:SWIM zinc finger family protein n=1 Tax=Streptomyces sp. NPDC006610 TaxID=3154584 RepID=UPI0033A26C83